MPSFRFKLIPFLATVIVVAIGCSLSYWQAGRAKYKETIEARLQVRENTPAVPLPHFVDIGQMEYTRVSLRGEFVSDWPVYLDNRPQQGAAGMVVVMPFKLQGENTYVLVLRGWLPRNSADRATIKPYSTPSGEIQIEGMLTTGSGHVMQLGQSATLKPGALRQNLTPEEFSADSRLPVQPFFIQQTSAQEDGLVRAWPRASAGSERHRGYAFQWLALAATALLFFIVTSFRKKSE